jgi:hypothetical protein
MITFVLRRFSSATLSWHFDSWRKLLGNAPAGRVPPWWIELSELNYISSKAQLFLTRHCKKVAAKQLAPSYW